MAPLPLPVPYIPGVPGSGLGDPNEFADNVQQNFDALATAVGQGDQYVPWVVVGAAGAPAFENSWVNYGSGYAVAAFMKDPMNFVHLKGLVKSGTAGSAIFTLPAGYRPSESLHLGTTAGGAAAECVVTNGGAVLANSGSTLYYSISNLTFRAEQ